MRLAFGSHTVLDYGPAGLADTLAAARAPGSLRRDRRQGRRGVGPIPDHYQGRLTIAIIGVSQVAELASSWVATGTRPGEANAIDLGHTLAAGAVGQAAGQRGDRVHIA